VPNGWGLDADYWLPGGFFDSPRVAMEKNVALMEKKLSAQAIDAAASSPLAAAAVQRILNSPASAQLGAGGAVDALLRRQLCARDRWRAVWWVRRCRGWRRVSV
jgi:hypothetical protein